MPRRPSDIEIKEPPIRELNKNKSCLKRSCLGGCLFLVVLALAFSLVIKFAASPRVKELNAIPAVVPGDLPIYDKENINRISYVSAKERGKMLGAVSFLPKFLLTPLYMSAERYLPEEVRHSFTSAEGKTGWEKYAELLREPFFSNRDMVEVEWTHLAAQPGFIKEFYEKELQKNGYKVTLIVNNKEIEEVRFTNTEKTISGVLRTEDGKTEERGTDRAILTLLILSTS